MVRVRKIIGKFTKWLEPKYRYKSVQDLPNGIKEKTIYVVGNVDAAWLIAFKCPCGCNEVIHLNLLREANPHWRFKINKKKQISISPSVWRTVGCRSHFFVRRGAIDWVGESEEHFDETKSESFWNLFSKWKP